MQRRGFIATIGASLLAVRGLRLAAAPAQDARLLVVFLRGGYDCANLLVPCASPFYYESRPGIAIARPDPANPQSALALDGGWGLHPALRDSILPLWQQGQAAFIPFAGTHDLSRSHFETQDSMESGQPLDGSRDYGSGFLNRLAGVLGGSSGVSFTDGLPLVMRGAVAIPNVSLRQFGKAPFDDRQMAVIAGMYRGQPLEAQVLEGFQLRKEVAEAYAKEMQEAGREAISSKGFELEARRVGRMMRERFNLGFIDVGGWDTHVNEGGAQGTLAGNVDSLGKGLAGYARELGAAWNRTVVVVLSEFGRTFRENGTRGTDHGHGSVHWVLGGAIHGRRLAGEQLAVEPKTLFQGRDYPVLNEYRATLGGLFRRLYGLSDRQLGTVFPGAGAVDLGLV
jgi:uncharacterized protein (DUF1501 family)